MEKVEERASQKQKAERRTVNTGHGSTGPAQRMQPRPSVRGFEESAPVSFEELQRRQDEFGLVRHPTKFRRTPLEELDEDTIPIPDVAPTPSD
jgi:hypothetical protein